MTQIVTPKAADGQDIGDTGERAPLIRSTSIRPFTLSDVFRRLDVLDGEFYFLIARRRHPLDNPRPRRGFPHSYANGSFLDRRCSKR